jgi:hypothetical protein
MDRPGPGFLRGPAVQGAQQGSVSAKHVSTVEVMRLGLVRLGKG